MRHRGRRMASPLRQDASSRDPGGIDRARRCSIRCGCPPADEDPDGRAIKQGSTAMFEISRRDLVLGSTGAALVFGLKGPVSFIGAAHAQRAADSLKYKVGDIEVFSLHEGSIERTVAEGMVKNASLDDVKKALTAAGIGPDKIQNPFTVTAIRTGGKVILFDTGFGNNGGATVGKLAD